MGQKSCLKLVLHLFPACIIGRGMYYRIFTTELAESVLLDAKLSKGSILTDSKNFSVQQSHILSAVEEP